MLGKKAPKSIFSLIYPWRLITGPYKMEPENKCLENSESPFGKPLYFQVPFLSSGGSNGLVREIKKKHFLVGG